MARAADKRAILYARIGLPIAAAGLLAAVCAGVLTLIQSYL